MAARRHTETEQIDVQFLCHMCDKAFGTVHCNV